jgi:hypothetical protein
MFGVRWPSNSPVPSLEALRFASQGENIPDLTLQQDRRRKSLCCSGPPTRIQEQVRDPIITLCTARIPWTLPSIQLTEIGIHTTLQDKTTEPALLSLSSLSSRPFCLFETSSRTARSTLWLPLCLAAASYSCIKGLVHTRALPRLHKPISQCNRLPPAIMCDKLDAAQALHFCRTVECMRMVSAHCSMAVT